MNWLIPTSRFAFSKTMLQLTQLLKTHSFLAELAKLWDPNEIGILTPGKIEIYAQPPNSPDTNILDLGLFNALQSAYWTHAPKNSGEIIIKMVQQTYWSYPADKINRMFVTLQSIYDCIIVEHGDNHYTTPAYEQGQIGKGRYLTKGASNLAKMLLTPLKNGVKSIHHANPTGPGTAVDQDGCHCNGSYN